MTNNKDIFYPFLKIPSYINTFLLITYQRLRTKDFDSNKNITINLWGEMFRIPINHRLPLYSHLYKNYSTNLRRVSSYIGNKYPKFTAIDVGANIGDSAILIRQGSDAKIICIEGDKNIINILRKNLRGINNIRIFNIFVGDKITTRGSFVVNNYGTGNINFLNGKKSVPIYTLDDSIKKEKDDDIKLLKIDTDGFDERVIKGASRIIMKNKPIMFFEFDEKLYKKAGCSTYETLIYLYKKGYVNFMVYDNFGNFLQGIPMSKIVSKNMFNKVFDYKDKEYYDLVGFNKIDTDLYKHALDNEERYFEKS